MDEEQCMHCANVVAQRQAEQGGESSIFVYCLAKRLPEPHPWASSMKFVDGAIVHIADDNNTTAQILHKIMLDDMMQFEICRKCC